MVSSAFRCLCGEWMDDFLTKIFRTRAPSAFHCLKLRSSDPVKKISGEPLRRCSACPCSLHIQEHRLQWFHCWELCPTVSPHSYEELILFFHFLHVVFCGTLFDRCWSRGGWEKPSYIWSQCPKWWRFISILSLLVHPYVSSVWE